MIIFYVITSLIPLQTEAGSKGPVLSLPANIFPAGAGKNIIL